MNRRVVHCLRLGALLLASAGILPASHVLTAQTASPPYTLVLRGVPMSQALEELARLTEIDLVYNSDLVAGKHVYCTGRAAEPEALLRCLLADSGLDYVRSSAGTYVLIEALRVPSRYGGVTGRIVDQVTGEPLPFANVLLADASTGTTTDDDGLFTLSDVLTGTHRLVVTYVGYEPAVDSVRVTPGDRRRVAIALRPRTVNLAPVVINGLTQRLPSSDLGRGTLTGPRLAALSTAGALDVTRGATALPGVSVQQPLADLHVQGGSSNEHLTLLDGVPVRSPVSLGRHLSAFSPLALDRLTVHKAGFSAGYGSHLVGIVAVEHDVAGPTRRHAVLSVDPVSVNGKIQQRFTLPGAREGAVMVALRRSLWDVYRDPGIEELLRRWNAPDPTMASIWLREPVTDASLTRRRHRADVGFSDAHAAARLSLSPLRTLYASVYRARNRIASTLRSVNVTDAGDHLFVTRDDYDWTNWAAQVRHHWVLSARAIGTVQIRGSWHDSHYTYDGLSTRLDEPLAPDQLDEAARALWRTAGNNPVSGEFNTIREVALHTALSYSLAPGREVDVAGTATHTSSRFRFGNPFIAPFSHEADAWEFAAYAAGEFSFGLQTTLEPGLRLTYVPLRGTVYAEPRLALRYDRSASRIGPYALRLAGGLYRQFTNQFELSSSGSTTVVPSIQFWLPSDRSLAPPRAYHLAADALFLPHPAWTIRLEAYAKYQPRLLTIDYAALLAARPAVRPVPPPAPLDQSAFVSATRGRALGAGVRVQRSVDWLTVAAGYSFSHVRRRFPGRFDNRLEVVPWNTPHRIDLDVRLNLTAHVTLDANGRGAWGRRWAFRQAYYDYLALREPSPSFAPFDLSHPAAPILPAQAQLDLGVTYAHGWQGARVQVRAFLVNALHRRTVYDWSLEETPTGAAEVARILPGRHPVLALRIGY